MSTPIPFEKWYESHFEIFKDYQFPDKELSKLLYSKLLTETFDCSKFFGIDTTNEPTLIYNPQDQNKILQPFEDVFFTDHCWMVEPERIYSEWKDLTVLHERLNLYLNKPLESNNLKTIEEIFSNCNGIDLELDFLNIENLSYLKIYEIFPNLESLSLYGNFIKDPNDLIETISNLKNLRALWINENPINEIEEIKEFIFNICPKLEIYNSKFTNQYTEWSLLYLSKNKNPETIVKLNLSDRNITFLNFNAFKPFINLLNIDLTLNNINNIKDIKKIIPSLLSIQIDDIKDLPEDLIFINKFDQKEQKHSIKIPENIWDHLQPIGERWALGDEIALSIHHSLTPNVATMPIQSPLNGQSYFVFWPVYLINPFDEIKADLYPLIPLGAKIDYNFQPKLTPLKSLSSKLSSSIIKKRPIKVFTDIEVFALNLKSDKFEIVKNPEEADLHWIGLNSVPDIKEYYENKRFINQIEGERCLTWKDLLYETITEFMGPVKFLPETFILTEPDQIERFIHKHKELENSNQSSVWIIKPFNLARASLMIVTDSLGEVLRHASIGPRLCQRYLWNPLTIFGQKFDLRFIVLLKSIKPFELFAYKVFWPRLSPKKWSLDDFDDYERHFTVMNYRSPTKVTSKNWYHFVEQFEIENPQIKWLNVLNRIYLTFKDLFICGGQKMIQSPYTKAMYGIDLMLTKDFQPIILECNFQPDCKRACNLCPTFVTDVFEVLFTDQPVNNENVTQIPI